MLDLEKGDIEVFYHPEREITGWDGKPHPSPKVLYKHLVCFGLFNAGTRIWAQNVLFSECLSRTHPSKNTEDSVQAYWNRRSREGVVQNLEVANLIYQLELNLLNECLAATKWLSGRLTPAVLTWDAGLTTVHTTVHWLGIRYCNSFCSILRFYCSKAYRFNLGHSCHRGSLRYLQDLKWAVFSSNYPIDLPFSYFDV